MNFPVESASTRRSPESLKYAAIENDLGATYVKSWDLGCIGHGL